MDINKKFHAVMEKLSVSVSELTSSSFGFAAALAIVLGWVVAGPILHFSKEWQMFISNGTATVTFLMVFLLQRVERKESKALHIKLNAIIKKLDGDMALLDIERTNEERLDLLEEHDHNKAQRVKTARIWEDAGKG